MLRRLHRAQAWSSSGYVCHSCRHKLLAAQRWQSTSASTQAVDDDWLSNFNDLGTSAPSPKSRKSTAFSNTSGAGKNEARARHKDGTKASQTKRQSAPDGGLASLRSNLNSRLQVKGTQELGKATETSVATPTPGAASSSPPKTRRGGPSRLRRDRRRAEAARRRPQGDTDDVERQFMRDTFILEEEDKTSTPSALAATPKAKDEKFEKLVQKLSEDVQRTFFGANAAQGKQRTHEETPSPAIASNTPSGSLPSPSFQAPTPAPLSLSGFKATTDEVVPLFPDPTAPEVVEDPHYVSTPDFNTASSTSDPSPRIRRSRSDGKEPSSLSQKVDEIRARPKWGGVELSSKEASGNYMRRPSFLQERKASDKDATAPSHASEPSYQGQSTNETPEKAVDRVADSVEPPLEAQDSNSSTAINLAKRLKKLQQNIGELQVLSKDQASEWEGRSSSMVEEQQSNGASERLAHLYHQQDNSPKLTALVEAANTQKVGASDKVPDKPDRPRKPNRRPSLSRKRRLRRETPERAKSSEVAKSTKSTGGLANERGHEEKSSDEITNSNDDGEEHKPLWEVMNQMEDMSASAAEEPTIEDTESQPAAKEPPPLDMANSGPANIASIQSSDLTITPLNIPQPRVPGLEYGLDRVLFNPGVYQLQDPLSRVYNFDPYLQKIMPVMEFDFNALKEYKTSSQDTALSNLAKEHNKRYIGSTSSMTSTLGHFHYLLSDFRPLNVSMVSRGFPEKADTFTQINRAPNAIFLRWKNGTYAIDADKEFDSANVLMMLGKSMEKLLTLPTEEYELYRRSNPGSIPEEERNAPESFEYTTMGDFLMRSQLDAHDSRLPGTGMFDLKTRAVVSVRMDAGDFEPMTGYEIHTLQGRFESYEREYYDMIRSTMLKYSLQARMGRMNGIFVAYHNVERIFGFQYVPIQEMDRALHGQFDPVLGDQEFKVSLELLNKVFDLATAKYPETSLRFHFETKQEAIGGAAPTTVMWAYAEPMGEAEIERIQSTSKEKVAEFERSMMGLDREAKDEDASSEDVSAAADEVNEAASSDGTAEVAAHEISTASASEAKSSTAEDASASTTKVDELTASSDYTTSASSADPAFIQSIQPKDPENLKPLFVASLICKSRVNGTPVQRPEKLQEKDKWDVEYLLQEWEVTEGMWARYEAMKAARKETFERYREEEEEGGEVPEDGEGVVDKRKEKDRKKSKAYLDWLRSMSQKGREFRAKIDTLEKDKEPVVLGRAGVKTTDGSSAEGIEDVEGYMSWMYKSK